MKKILLILLLCLSCVGCGNNDNNEEETSTNNSDTEITYKWNDFEKYTTLLNENYNININYNDQGNISQIVICDGLTNDVNTWTNGIQIGYVNEEIDYLNNSKFPNNKHVTYIRYGSNHYNEEFTDEQHLELFHPVDNTFYVYNPIVDYSDGNEKPDFYNDIPNYKQFSKYVIDELGFASLYDFIGFCNMVYINDSTSLKSL